MKKRYVIVASKPTPDLNTEFFHPYGINDFVWLSPNKACEVLLDTPLNLKDCHPFDVFEFGPQETHRKKELLFCDMDATILKDESLDEIAKYLPQDIKDLIAKMTLQTMYGKVDLEQSIRQRVSYLKDQPISVLQEAAESCRLNSGARTLIQTMKNNGATCVLISSGFTHISSPVAEKVGFDEDHANQLDTKDGFLTGLVNGVIIDGEGKGRITAQTIKRSGLNAHHAVAVGDGSNDIYMLNETDMGIAFYGKPILKEKARHQINYTDLTSVLYAQGYKDNEISFLPDHL